MWAGGRDMPETSGGQRIVPVVSGVVFPQCRALLVNVGGTADVIDAAGNIVTGIPLQAGYNPIYVTKVTLGTASGVWALY